MGVHYQRRTAKWAKTVKDKNNGFKPRKGRNPSDLTKNTGNSMI